MRRAAAYLTVGPRVVAEACETLIHRVRNNAASLVRGDTPVTPPSPKKHTHSDGAGYCSFCVDSPGPSNSAAVAGRMLALSFHGL